MLCLLSNEFWVWWMLSVCPGCSRTWNLAVWPEVLPQPVKTAGWLKTGWLEVIEPPYGLVRTLGDGESINPVGPMMNQNGANHKEVGLEALEA